MEDTVRYQFVLDCLQNYLQVCILLVLSHASLNSLVVHLLAWLRIFVQIGLNVWPDSTHCDSMSDSFLL